MLVKTKYPLLFSPLRIRNTYFRNRLFCAPQGQYNVCSDRVPTLESIAFYERKAIGGFATVNVGTMCVDIETGANLPFYMDMLNEDAMPRFGQLAASINRHGAVATAELSWDGQYSWASRDMYGTKLYGPDECENQYGHVEEMTDEMIWYIIDRFAKGAAFAKHCGFGMVTIHAGHGWGPSQFMNPNLNHRTDKWGGTPENRMRFSVEICDAIRKACGPNFPIEFRFSGSEVVPQGYGLDTGLEIASALDGHADILHVTAGTHEVGTCWSRVHPSMFHPEAINREFAHEVRKVVKDSYIGLVGALNDPAIMEDILASGDADIINVARQSIADPDFPIKVKSGHEDEVARCIRCNKCLLNNGIWRTERCSLNPEIGQEADVRMEAPTLFKKKILVVGGGIAGMSASIELAKRGHEVTLCEKTDHLGGAITCEHNVPFKKNLPLYIKRQEVLMEKAGVDVKLNTTVTPEDAEAFNADVIVAAVGARPIVPKFEGADKAICAEEAYIDPDLAKGKVVVLGSGLVGLELAIYLGTLGKDVTVLEAMDQAGVDLKDYAFMIYDDKLKEYNIDLKLSHLADKFDGSTLSVKVGEEAITMDCDTLIYAIGQRSLAEEADSLALCAPEFYAIGDCIKPDSLLSANGMALGIAQTIGKML